MAKHAVPVYHLDLYAEVCPASSVTIIGAGLVTISTGSLEAGFAVVLAGIGVGIAGPMARYIQKRHKPGN